MSIRKNKPTVLTDIAFSKVETKEASVNTLTKAGNTHTISIVVQKFLSSSFSIFVSRFISGHPTVIFFVLLGMTSLAYRYETIMFSPPQSIHRWRQTDGASVALNYYKHGMQFFKPETHALTSDEATTGYSAGEFPLLYYVVAILYKITGPNDSVFRIFNMLIFFYGLYSLFRICQLLFRDNFFAILLPLLIFTSPVAAYYGSNYLPDTAALALVFRGWLFFIRQEEKNTMASSYPANKNGSLQSGYLLAVLFFTVAGLLKVTMSISLITVLLIAVFRNYAVSGKLANAILTILPAITGMLIIAAWYIYAVNFNETHDSATFLTSVKPWWALDREGRKELNSFILERNLHLYFSYNMIAVIVVSIVFFVFRGRRISGYYFPAVLLMLGGGFAYLNLWYTQFQYHDYYFIVLLAPLGLMFAGTIMAVKESCPRFFRSVIFRIAFVILFIFNVLHARHEMILRYYGWKREAPVYEEYFDIKPYLESIDIRPDDRVISIPDGTNCYTLYMMDKPGNNLPGINEYTGDAIKLYRSLGAKYLFVNDTSLLNYPVLKEFTNNEAGRKGNVRIFRLVH